MMELLCGAGTFLTSFIVASVANENFWTNLLIAIISAVVYAVLNIGVKIITSILEKKGLISSEHKKMIDETADDLADDGKINNSNKKD